MNARVLLAHVEARGASVRVEHGDNGAAVLVVAPRSKCVDLLPELARFKPALVELLAPKVEPTDDEARARFPAHLRRAFCDADRVAIGHCLLRLDAGEEIE